MIRTKTCLRVLAAGVVAKLVAITPVRVDEPAAATGQAVYDVTKAET